MPARIHAAPMALVVMWAAAATFVRTPFALASSCRSSSLAGVQALLDDAEAPDSKPKITQAGIDKFRERQRLRAEGQPLSSWSKSLDRSEQEGGLPCVSEHAPVPPTEEQKQAADDLFEKVLRDEDLPDGFGVGLDELGI